MYNLICIINYINHDGRREIIRHRNRVATKRMWDDSMDILLKLSIINIMSLGCN